VRCDCGGQSRVWPFTLRRSPPFAKCGACAYCSCHDAPQRCEAMLADAREKQSARCRRTAPCAVAEWRAPVRRPAHSQPVAQARGGQIASATRVLRALAIGAEKRRQGEDTNEAKVPKGSAKANADAKADRSALTGEKASVRHASHRLMHIKLPTPCLRGVYTMPRSGYWRPCTGEV
jgi:hypothetical protein